MNTVFVLTHTWQVDSGDFGTETFVFGTIEKAEKKFKSLMKKAKKDFKDLDTEQDHYVKGDMTWSIWEKEEYAYNHIDLIISEKEVQ